MANFIKRFFQEKALNKKGEDRNKKFLNLSQIKTCGFIINSKEEFVINTVSILENYLSSNEINSKGLYINCTGKKETNKFKNNKNVKYIDIKEINWFGVPNKEIIQDFLEEPFDVLFDLSNLYTNYTHKYILTHSQASFIIGFHKENTEFYDLTLNFADKQMNNTDEIVHAAFKFLKNINNRTNN